MEFPDPTLGPGEAVIEIKASGMCGSDLKMHLAKGGAAALGLVGDGSPLAAGHEPCGVIVAVGEGRRPGYGSAIQRLRGLQALPGRLVAALSRWGDGLRRHGTRRARQEYESAGPHIGETARRIVL